MLNRPSRSLAFRLTLRASLVGAVMTAALLGIFLTRYLLDTAFLRQSGLQAAVNDIAAAIDAGRNPATLPWFRHHRGSYGFRVFDRRTPELRHLLAQAGTELLPPATTEGPNGADEAMRLVENFSHWPASDANDRWLLTDRLETRKGGLWVQAVTIGDPAWLWQGAVATEMIDHVAVPVLTIVPALLVAIYFTIRATLRPLSAIARQAGAIGATVAAGAHLEPLRTGGLPRELAQLVAAINGTLRSLERSLQVQRQFAADAAHELRTPLAVLMLQCGLLEDGEIRDRMQAEVKGLSNLVTELLRFAEAENALSAGHELVDLVVTARQACEGLVPVALARRQLVEFDAPDGTVSTISGNPTLIEIAIRNLLNNAITYSPPRSTVQVTVRGTAVTVEDAGPGIPAGQRGRVFDRFWRADERRGSGIGLALVRRIAQLHAGEIRLEDRPGGGSRFTLILPAAT